MTQAPPCHTFLLDQKDTSDTLLAAIAALDDHLGADEIVVQDLLKITTLSDRATGIIALLTGAGVIIPVEDNEAEVTAAVAAVSQAMIDQAECLPEATVSISALPIEPAEDAQPEKVAKPKKREGWKTCPVCGKNFKSAQAYCSKPCYNKAYRDRLAAGHAPKARKQAATAPTEEPAPPETLMAGRILDIKTGNFYGPHELAQLVKDGKFEAGRKFRKAGNVLAIVEKAGSSFKLRRIIA